MSDPVDVPSIQTVHGTGIPVRGNDIDTDQIIPARFLKVLTFDGLGEFAFFDKRYETAGPGGDNAEAAENPTDHPFNQVRYEGANTPRRRSSAGASTPSSASPSRRSSRATASRWEFRQ